MAAFVLYIKPQEEMGGSKRSLTSILYEGYPGSKSLRDQLLNDNAVHDNDTCWDKAKRKRFARLTMS